jgi:hypothetical protein
MYGEDPGGNAAEQSESKIVILEKYFSAQTLF